VTTTARTRVTKSFRSVLSRPSLMQPIIDATGPGLPAPVRRLSAFYATALDRHLCG
jgi:hypothetical protein